MEKIAEIFDMTFAGFDGGVFRFMNHLADSMGGFLTPLCKAITFLGEKGIIFFLLAFVLMLFKKTRKLGVCMFGAVACGALITNIILKDSVMRERPFTNEEYKVYWQFIGSPAEDGFSFPSGHATSVTAAMTAIFILCNKKWSWVGFIGVLLMGFARVYLIAHYTTDVLAGVIVGAVSGIVAFFIAKLIFFILEKNKENKFCNFCLECDVKNLLKK